jgi:D-serine deaminase-like pyridoxal phosphate-dependent protein
MVKLNITRPTLLLDKNICLKNISMMADKARQNNLILRPHFKTHQSAEIGSWFKDFGVNSIAVSSVKMAKYFSENGWDDITIAFPVNILEINSINDLAEKIKINLLVESIETVEFLNDNLKNEFDLFIKIDTGYHRTGIFYKNGEKIAEVVSKINNSLKQNFKGFLIHAGHSYKADSVKMINKIHKETLTGIKHLIDEYKSKYPDILISSGDTPSCSLMDDFTGIDEIRPGNFVFYDLMQCNIGSCSFEQIAVALACPVVAKHKERNEIVIYGGAVHLSKEFIVDKEGNTLFGSVVEFENSQWSRPIEDTYLKSVSQEHGIIKAGKDFFNKIKVGDILGIIPVHSCLTSNLMKEYLTLDNEHIEMMK